MMLYMYYHGNDYSEGLNLFGGMNGFSGLKNTCNFSKFKGKVYSLGIDFPPYHKWIKERLDKTKSQNKPYLPEWDDVDLDNLKRMHEEAETLEHPHKTKKLIIGDSHSICLYRPGWMVKSIPFKTLNGMLSEKDAFESCIGSVDEFWKFDEIEFYFGNIDVRHHLCRIGGNSIENTIKLANDYVKEINRFNLEYGYDITLYELLPIEDESRVIPKTGYHKGKPFWGNWSQRNSCRLTFRDEIKKAARKFNNIKIKTWSDYLMNDKKQLSFDCMETPRSVHLSREHYPYWQGQDWDNTITNNKTSENNSLNQFFN